MENRMKNIRIIYIAGKYTADCPFQVKMNILEAELWGVEIAQLGAMPLIPHCNTAHWEGLRDSDWFYEGTLELLRRCDAIFLCPGWEKSKGVQKEVEEAERLRLPIFKNIESVEEWLNLLDR